jgi:hypothetical protein
MGFVHARNIVLPNRTPNTGSVSDSGSVRVHHHGIYHARRSVVRQYIIDKLKAEGEKAYITKEDPKVIMARIVQRCIAVCSLKRCVPMYKAQPSPS